VGETTGGVGVVSKEVLVGLRVVRMVMTVVVAKMRTMLVRMMMMMMMMMMMVMMVMRMRMMMVMEMMMRRRRRRRRRIRRKFAVARCGPEAQLPTTPQAPVRGEEEDQ
jgi:hypothetical protein